MRLFMVIGLLVGCTSLQALRFLETPRTGIWTGSVDGLYLTEFGSPPACSAMGESQPRSSHPRTFGLHVDFGYGIGPYYVVMGYTSSREEFLPYCGSQYKQASGALQRLFRIRKFPFVLGLVADWMQYQQDGIISSWYDQLVRRQIGIDALGIGVTSSIGGAIWRSVGFGASYAFVGYRACPTISFGGHRCEGLPDHISMVSLGLNYFLSYYCDTPSVLILFRMGWSDVAYLLDRSFPLDDFELNYLRFGGPYLGARFLF